MSKYVIIDEEVIQKEIEELKKQYDQKSKVNDSQWCSIISGQILALERILSQSTPLIPVIKQAFIEGFNSEEEVYKGNATGKIIGKKEYLSNLKIEI